MKLTISLIFLVIIGVNMTPLPENNVNDVEKAHGGIITYAEFYEQRQRNETETIEKELLELEEKELQELENGDKNYLW